MDKTEMAVKALCAGLDAWDMLTGKLPFMCAVTGHKWGTRSMSDCRNDRFYCTRCGHVEYADTAAQYRESTVEAFRQAGMPAPVMMSDESEAYRYVTDSIAKERYGGLEN